MTRHELQCDVLVAGGGPAGIGAALAAARSGAKVVLCQDRSVLGGNASSEVRMHIVGADSGGRRREELATETREGGIIEEIRLDTAVHNPQRSASMLDLILYDKCRSEENLTLLLDTAVTGAVVDGDRIQYAIAERQSTEDIFDIHAKLFIDCTGDGRLGVEAGAPFRRGREGRDAFGETYAPDEADDLTLGSSLLFQARKVDKPAPFTPPSWARKFTEEDLKLRPHASVGLDRGLEYGYWWAEWGGTLDTIKDNATIRDELLAIMLGVWDHIKNGGDHGADEWVLDWFGFLPGKRESRRFIGLYTLCEADLIESKPFDDAIAYGGWPIDLHPPDGIDAKDEKPATQYQLQYLYDIPLRACVAQTPANLMFAGRNISATHVAFGSTRVMATCMAMGQGVGTAAALAAQHGISAHELCSRKELIRTLQQRLLRDDAYLIGVLNEDPDDLARQASVQASSEQAHGPARNILSGQTRSVHGDRGAPPDRIVKGTHRWMSDPASGLPASIELTWDEPVTIGEVRIVFDTGMHRVLTLSHSDGYLKRMKWGVPQPETVKAYTVEALVDGAWKIIADVPDNYQRLRVHRLDTKVVSSRLRVVCHETHGIDHARIFEIRVYS